MMTYDYDFIEDIVPTAEITMTTLPCNRLILQSDWNESLREENGKAWMSFKSAAPTSVYSELNCHGRSVGGLPYLTSRDESFTVTDITTKSLVLSYNGEEASISRKFVCPSVTYTDIHSQNKMVRCVDSTAGGLGVSADSEGKLKVWQTDTGEVRRELTGHLGDVYSCRFFPSGIVVLSAGADMMAKVWSVETGQCAATLTGHRAAILDTAIVDRGRNVVTAGRDGTAKLWDVGQQQCLATFSDIGGDVNCLCFGTPENSIDLGQDSGVVSDREVSTEGKMLLLGCENATLQGHGLRSREQIFSISCESAVNCCCFVSETYCAAGTHDGFMYIVDVRNTSVPLNKWKESRGPVLCLLPHKGGVFASTGDGSCFHVNEHFDTTTELTGSDCDPLYSMGCDGSHIYTSCRDGAIRRYSLTYL